MFFEKLNFFFSKKAKLVTLCHHLGKAHVKGFVVVSRTVKVRVDDVRYNVVMVSRTVKVRVDDVRYGVVVVSRTVKVRVDDVRYSVVMVSRTVKIRVDDVRYSVVWPDSTPVSNGGSSAPMVCL